MSYTALALAAFLAYGTLDQEMSSQEKRKTGVDKLTYQQKAALKNWVDANYEKKEVNRASKLESKQKHPSLQENLRSGHFIKLSDESLWNIHPQDVPITQGWITPVDILVVDEGEKGDQEYPYKLTNSLTGSSVRARKATSINPPKPTSPPK